MNTVSLPDAVLSGLRAAIEAPDLTGTRYRLIRELGRGGMGVVYEVEDTVLDRRLALKVMEADVGEGRLIAQLEHPGIVPVHDAGTLPDGRTYYAMKLIRGQRMDEWMRDHPTLRARLGMFLRVCQPVAFAHARGIAHRDLKPSNVMIGDWGEVLVLDWGTGGTEGYMPPEPASGPRGDVYSLGRILGKLGEGLMPPPLRSICRKATEEDPAARYADASALADEVERFIAGERVTAHPETIVDAARRLGAKHRVMIALVSTYLLMRAAIVIFT